jgi:hypothetical protein
VTSESCSDTAMQMHGSCARAKTVPVPPPTFTLDVCGYGGQGRVLLAPIGKVYELVRFTSAWPNACVALMSSPSNPRTPPQQREEQRLACQNADGSDDAALA